MFSVRMVPLLLDHKGDLYSHECAGENQCQWKKLEIIPAQPENSGYGTCPPELETIFERQKHHQAK